MLTTDRFQIRNVTGTYSASTGLSPRPAAWVGVESMDVKCLGCAWEWAALPMGAGHFDQTINGATIVTCPGCGIDEPVSNRALQRECEG